MGEHREVVVVGGGVVGLATAMAVCRRLPGAGVVVLESEAEVGSHQSSRNSGVIHSGLYYAPGSLKARLCTEGAREMFEFCSQRGVPFDRCGKLVVATSPPELPRLDELERRGRANGLPEIRRLGPDELREIEPHAAGLAALHIPSTGITDFSRVAKEMAAAVRELGGEVRLATRLVRSRREAGAWLIETNRGQIRSKIIIACAGLHSDAVARACGFRPDVRIVPFRGEYYQLKPHALPLVRNLIYPVPDPAMPFLGVHFTRMIGGGVEAGPNAVLALSRHGYTWLAISPSDLAAMACSPGFWQMSRAHWKTGVMEMWRSLSTSRFVRDLQKLVPAVRANDLTRARAGVRAQAVDRQGRLVQDFRIVASEGAVHVLNAPSPAATASLAIGRAIADLALGTEAREVAPAAREVVRSSGP